MPMVYPLVLADPRSDQLEDTRKDGTRLLGIVLFLGGHYHLTFLRVTEVTVDINGVPDTGDTGWEADHGELRTDCEDDQVDLEYLKCLYDAHFETVNVPGYAGKYVVDMMPYGR